MSGKTKKIPLCLETSVLPKLERKLDKIDSASASPRPFKPEECTTHVPLILMCSYQRLQSL
jgi:hypothetical protein